jgi:hypothetical protein
MIPDLIVPIRPLQLYADGGYQLRIRRLEGTPNYGPRQKGSNKKEQRKPKAALVWRTGLFGVPPDSVRCTRENSLQLLSFGFQKMALCYNSPDCPV